MMLKGSTHQITELQMYETKFNRTERTNRQIHTHSWRF